MAKAVDVDFARISSSGVPGYGGPSSLAESPSVGGGCLACPLVPLPCGRPLPFALGVSTAGLVGSPGET